MLRKTKQTSRKQKGNKIWIKKSSLEVFRIHGQFLAYSLLLNLPTLPGLSNCTFMRPYSECFFFHKNQIYGWVYLRQASEHKYFTCFNSMGVNYGDAHSDNKGVFFFKLKKGDRPVLHYSWPRYSSSLPCLNAPFHHGKYPNSKK